MLSAQGRKDRPQDFHQVGCAAARLLTLAFAATLLHSCHSGGGGFPRAKTADDIREWVEPRYTLRPRVMRRAMDSLAAPAERKMYADAYTARYYLGRGAFVWITRHGADSRADTLLALLREAGADAIPPSRLHAGEIEALLREARARDTGGENISRLMGRLEYRLTQSYLRLAAGQRYGFTRPQRLLNRLLAEDDSGKTVYHRLFDLPVEAAGDSFYALALRRAREGRAAAFLRGTRPAGRLYATLRDDYRDASRRGDAARARLARVNMERARWRYPRPSGKHVWVNLAGLTLTAVGGDGRQALTMRVCGGSMSHKTPLLQSRITHLELDPYWTVPLTIVRKEIAPLHAGDTAYFSRNRYRVIDRETSLEVSPLALRADELASGRYTVRQDNGEGNSLGRMIFRFPNRFSVYLHDTNNRQAFSRPSRAVSHGCVRLERPLDLAEFLMDKPDSAALDRMRVAAGLPPLTRQGREREERAGDGPRRTGRHTYKPPVPLFIDYYTLWPGPDGRLEAHPDTYGYDGELLRLLDAF